MALQPEASHNLGEIAKPEIVTGLDFAEFPPLTFLIRPVAGIKYLFVSPGSQGRASRDLGDEKLPWAQIAGVPLFTVAGEDCILLAKGVPIPGASVDSSATEIMVEAELEKRVASAQKKLGIETKESENEKMDKLLKLEPKES